MNVRFEWDPAKADANRSKHGVSFETACEVFNDPLHLSVQDRHVGGEERWITIGMAGDMLILAVAHTVREAEDEEVLRIISARRATQRERERYEEGI